MVATAQATEGGDGVRTPILAELVRLGVAQGASARTLLDTVGELSEPSAHVPYQRAKRLWSMLAEQRPHLPHGLVLGAASTTTFGALLSASAAAQTKRDALRTMVALFSAFTTDGRLSLHRERDGTRLTLRHRRDVEGLGHPIEFAAGLLIRLVAGAAGADAVRSASFRHRPLGERSAYAPHVGDSTRFEAEHNTIVFRDEALDVAHRGTDPLVTLQRRLEQLHAPGAPQDLVLRRIEDAVARATARGHFDVAATARELGLSPRTLQRRAKDAGLELRALLQSARHALALELLRDRTLSLRAVAERLDYADERSFSRAFERWTGTTPARWRRRHRG